MKYIRMKDGIYETTKENDIAFMVKGNRGYEISKLKDRVIKQAGTIEELCDEFVYISKLGTDYKRTYKTLEHLKQAELDCLEYADVYGAIRTDKERIYVAKMNEKGELELL